MLKSQPGPALLRRLLVAALALAARGIGHRMGLVEDDRAVEVRPKPFDDLLDAARLALAALFSALSLSACAQTASPAQSAGTDAKPQADAVKIGVLAGSLLSALAGALLLRKPAERSAA